MAISFFLAVPLLAFAYRARGGAMALSSTTLARVIFWALPVGGVCGAILYTWHLPIWIGAICAIMAFAGACIGHSSEQARITDENIGMGAITAIMLFLILFPITVIFPGSWYSVHNPIILTVIGLMGAPAYIIGWRVPFPLTIFGKTWCAAQSTEWGEFLTGAFAFGLPLAILGALS